MLSANLAKILSSGIGKYWYWAKRLDADNLEVLLWAIGEFGSCSAAAGFPEPEFYKHAMAEDRMRNALKILARIRSIGRVELDYGPFRRSTLRWIELSEHVSAFSNEYREHLSKDEHSGLAQGLDERNVGILLWMVGEYGIRVNSSSGPDGGDYPPPSFDADSYLTKPMRAALRLIAEIERGESITTTEASRRIAENED
jgi:hypothetical protein